MAAGLQDAPVKPSAACGRVLSSALLNLERARHPTSTRVALRGSRRACSACGRVHRARTMPPRAAPAAAAPAQGDAGEPPAAGGGLFSGSTLKLIALFFLIQMALQPGGPVFKALGLSKPEATVKDAAGVVVPGPASATQSAAAVKAVQASPLWPMGTPFVRRWTALDRVDGRSPCPSFSRPTTRSRRGIRDYRAIDGPI